MKIDNVKKNFSNLLDSLSIDKKTFYIMSYWCWFVDIFALCFLIVPGIVLLIKHYNFRKKLYVKLSNEDGQKVYCEMYELVSNDDFNFNDIVPVSKLGCVDFSNKWFKSSLNPKWWNGSKRSVYLEGNYKNTAFSFNQDLRKKVQSNGKSTTVYYYKFNCLNFWHNNSTYANFWIKPEHWKLLLNNNERNYGLESEEFEKKFRLNYKIDPITIRKILTPEKMDQLIGLLKTKNANNKKRKIPNIYFDENVFTIQLHKRLISSFDSNSVLGKITISKNYNSSFAKTLKVIRKEFNFIEEYFEFANILKS